MNKTQRDWSKVQRLKSPRQVNIRLTTEEMERLDAIAREQGVSKAGYVKSRVFGGPIPKSSKRPKAVEADLRQVLGLLGHLGSNANQMARLCNSGKGHPHEAAATLQEIKSELAVLRALLLQALGSEP